MGTLPGSSRESQVCEGRSSLLPGDPTNVESPENIRWWDVKAQRVVQAELRVSEGVRDPPLSASHAHQAPEQSGSGCGDLCPSATCGLPSRARRLNTCRGPPSWEGSGRKVSRGLPGIGASSTHPSALPLGFQHGIAKVLSRQRTPSDVPRVPLPGVGEQMYTWKVLVNKRPQGL